MLRFTGHCLLLEISIRFFLIALFSWTLHHRYSLIMENLKPIRRTSTLLPEGEQN
jgi:hypothetical protein